MDALNKGNTITPSGNARIADQNPIVSINSLVIDPQDLGNIPDHSGSKAFICATWAGSRTERTWPPASPWSTAGAPIYLPIVKTSDASTLAVVNGLKENLDRMRSVLPEDVKLTLEFDQSPYVTNAISGVANQSMIGGILTGIMVLLFLRDWRTVVVVAVDDSPGFDGGHSWACGRSARRSI